MHDKQSYKNFPLKKYNLNCSQHVSAWNLFGKKYIYIMSGLLLLFVLIYTDLLFSQPQIITKFTQQ